MPRNMSFAMTTQQIRDRRKWVTRRFGWAFSKPGDIVNAVEKSMGMQKGEKVVRLCEIKVVSTRWEPLNAINQLDCVLEGLPQMEPHEFVAMLVQKYRCEPDAQCNRIEFDYLD